MYLMALYNFITTRLDKKSRVSTKNKFIKQKKNNNTKGVSKTQCNLSGRSFDLFFFLIRID